MKADEPVRTGGGWLYSVGIQNARDENPGTFFGGVMDMKTWMHLTAALCLFASALCAQSLTSLNGLVTDATGSVVPGAAVDLEKVDTQAKRSTTADSTGHSS